MGFKGSTITYDAPLSSTTALVNLAFYQLVQRQLEVNLRSSADVAIKTKSQRRKLQLQVYSEICGVAKRYACVL